MQRPGREDGGAPVPVEHHPIGPGTGRSGTMSKGVLPAAILALIWAAALAAQTYDAVGKTALDGDSLVVEFPSGLEVEVRLLSVDCPERGQPFSDEARELSRRYVAGRSLVLQAGSPERDRYRRLLAFVSRPGETSLNVELLERGLAVVHIRPPNVSRADELLAAQARAHGRRVGVWTSDGAMLEPRSHRARKRDPGAVVRPLRYEDHLIVGNRRSRVAHWPACRHVTEMKPDNRVVLGTVAEARRLGYRMERGYR